MRSIRSVQRDHLLRTWDGPMLLSNTCWVGSSSVCGLRCECMGWDLVVCVVTKASIMHGALPCMAKGCVARGLLADFVATDDAMQEMFLDSTGLGMGSGVWTPDSTASSTTDGCSLYVYVCVSGAASSVRTCKGKRKRCRLCVSRKSLHKSGRTECGVRI